MFYMALCLATAETDKKNDGWGGESDGWGAGGEKNSRSNSNGFEGSGKSRGRGCFKCGEDGHMSRDCPTGGSGGGGNRGRGCFKCGEDGHMSRDCPQGGGNRCFKCKKEGHISSDCTESGNEDSKKSFGFGDDNGSFNDVEPSEEPKRPLYVPPEPDESILTETIAPGTNFQKSILTEAVVVQPEAYKDKFYSSFDEAVQSETLISALKAMNFTKPTPIQKYAMRLISEGMDMMGCACTGSGKTLAFVLPILQHLFNEPELPNGYGQESQEILALVICPTHELARQVFEVFYKFTRNTIVKTSVVYGGTSVRHSRNELSKGCHVLVGTPGRVKHFVKDGYINFTRLKYLVIDEADRMVDDGFMPEIRVIISDKSMPKPGQRQTLMFSATISSEVEQLAANELVSDYVYVMAGVREAANSDIEQTVLQVERSEKKAKLMEILGSNTNNDRTIIFVETKQTADYLAGFLSKSDYRSTSMHGDRFQSQRETALRDLKSGKFPILVATNVAARGLDVNAIQHVINYDLPKEIDEYIHRIGRTGRIGNPGKATSFYDPGSSHDKNVAKDLVKVMENCFVNVPEWLKEEAGFTNDNNNSAESSQEVRLTKNLFCF